jgi:hypothetical protein
MDKPKAEPQKTIERLSRYVGLEADAVEAYALAACRLRDLGAVEVIGKFRTQHEGQRDELSRLLAAAGGEPFDPLRPRRPLTPGLRLLAACDGDAALLEVLLDGERARMLEYEAALRAQVEGAGARNALERGYFGCRTRLQWLERRSLERSDVRTAVGAPAAAGARRRAR